MNKSPKIVHFAIGHEGLHAVLVAEDGTVFFAGTARRGEDGDQSEYNGGCVVLCCSVLCCGVLWCCVVVS